MRELRVFAETRLKFGRPFTPGESAAMLAAHWVTRGEAQKKRRAMREAACTPIQASN
jgi:hypothetical protein